MRKTKYTVEQISQALADFDTGFPLEKICAQLDISVATFYNWRKKYCGLLDEDLKVMMTLQEENRSLKSDVEELLKDRDLLQSIVSKMGKTELPIGI